MPEPAVWMCFGNSYSEKLKPSDKALSSEVVKLKPFKACRYLENRLHRKCFFFFWGGENFLELFKIFVPWKLIYCK